MVREGLTGRGSRRGVRMTPRNVLVGGLLAALIPGAWGAGGGEPQPSGRPSPEGCVHAPTARCLIRLSLAAVDEISDAASRAQALAHIAEAQAAAGEAGEARDSLARALAAAGRVDAAGYAWDKLSPDEQAFGEQARVLSLIARVQADAGDPGGARETFSRAEAAAHGIGFSSVRAAALLEVAKMQIAAGALPEVRRTLARADLTGDDWTLRALPELVRAQAEAGDVAGALITARTIPGDEHPRTRAKALVRVAAVQAAAGDEPGALVTAGEIESQHYRMSAMRHIGAARAERGDMAGAWDAVRAIQDDIWFNPRLRDDTDGRGVTLAQAATIAAIAHAHIARGELGEASAAIRNEEMEDDFTYMEVRAAIAKARIAAGPLDTARGRVEAMCEVVEPDYYDYYRHCAEAQAAAYTALMREGEAEEARRAFSSALAAATAEGVLEPAEALLSLGLAAAREGDSGSADRWAAGGGISVRMLVLAGLAGMRAGHADTARALLSRAVAAVTSPERGDWHVKALAEVAYALAFGRWPAADRYPGSFQ